MNDKAIENPKEYALAKRAVACKAWRWLPGMRCTHRWAGGIRVLADEDGKQSEAYVVLPDADGNAVMKIDECAIMGDFSDADSANPFLPDLTDPATLGCLLALVREAWGDPGASVWHDRRTGRWCWMADGCLHSVHRPSDEGYSSEAEALVAALETRRPGRVDALLW